MSFEFGDKVSILIEPFQGVSGTVQGIRPINRGKVYSILFDKQYEVDGVIYGTIWCSENELTSYESTNSMEGQECLFSQ